MVRVGTIGIGFMGMIHYLACKKIQDGKVTAICTRSEKKLQGDWTDIQGNFGPRGGHEDLSQVKKYRQIDELLADPGIDLVDICLGTHLHKEVTIKALQAGKHVLVEKPIEIGLPDAREMVAAARKARRCLMVAHVLPFFPEFEFAYEAVSSGRFGALLGGHFKRIISKPNWSPDLVDLSKSGGPGIDLHIHDTHFIQLLSGKPDAVFSRGIVAGKDYLQYVTTQYLYRDKNVALSCSSGALSQPGRAFTHGFEIYLEKATLLFDFATLGGKPVSTPLTLIDARGQVTQPQLKSTDPVDAFVGEMQYAVQAIGKGTDPAALSGEGALAALELCWKEAESVKTGKIVRLRR
ncbi:MAG: Gfo/Idh/MocA family oxidoreductase [Planctomycetes bacterium]|nr:Gfo/Idh/MocA family oxidoreductase [Planctomycetota bacterium]